jgi:hypothetical protein
MSFARDVGSSVELHAGTGGDEPAHDDVLFEASEVVHFAVDGGFGEDSRGLLERSGGDEGVGRKGRLPWRYLALLFDFLRGI